MRSAKWLKFAFLPTTRARKLMSGSGKDVTPN
jgi:hypothetical protein